jgi:hypothetical protein
MSNGDLAPEFQIYYIFTKDLEESCGKNTSSLLFLVVQFDE